MIFSEGKWYSFKIINQIEIAEQGSHYVLQHSSGRKILLLADNYVKYNFKIASFIECRVDKVNCTGQIFMEPKHPHYEIGEIYNFKLLAWDSIANFIEVEDIFKNRVQLFSQSAPKINPNNEIQLKISNIKKGKPILAFPDNKDKCNTSVEINSIIKAFVSEIILLNNEEYYKVSVLECFGLIKVKHYSNYGFTIGDEIQCRYLGTKPDGSLNIEPINPDYAIGNIYQFSIVDFEEIADIEDNITIIATVLDVNSKKCGIKIPKNELNKGHVINCKVTGYRKGRPQLEIVL